jgi:peptide/nickel transport system substrate-binding protein
MRAFNARSLIYGTLGAGVALGLGFSAAAETPVKGGVLQFVVGSKIPSYDGHQETTFGMIHPIRPFYSLLIRINPDNPQSTTDFICDLCESYDADAKSKTYTFNIRQNVKFHDGTPLTAADIKATLDKIIFPPEGVPSSRKAWYTQVASIETPEKYKLVINLKRPLAAMLPALASPFNFVYSKKDLDEHGYSWHKSNINGTGAFKFVQHQPGAFVEGARNENYFVKGKPYLDGYKAISAPKMSVRLQAIRGDRAAIEFRGFPPKARDDLVKALGDKVKVQESDWNVFFGYGPNQNLKRFQDVRVRQALGYALDRWNGAKYLSKIAIIKSVGGIVFPGHALEASQEHLETFPGYGRDVKADQSVVPSGPWYAGLRKTRDKDVVIDINAQSVINPSVDVSKWIPGAGNNYTNNKDPKTTELYLAMLNEADPKKQYQAMRAYEDHLLKDEAIFVPGFWWYKINPHRTYVKGWKIAPSHYLNQALDQVWIDPKLR